MTPEQAAYRAGCVVSEIDARFPLTPAALGNAANLPNKLPAVLRHVWRKAAAVPEIAALLDDFDPPEAAYPPVVQGAFWIGYYHQKTARGLPGDFGGRLKALRERANMTLQDLADASGLSKQVIHNYEGGRRPTWDAVQLLAKAFGVSTDTFSDR